MKRLVFILAFLLTLLSLPAIAQDDTALDVDSRFAAVYNVETKTLLYDKGAGTIIYPASLTKIMTGILACEYYEERGGDFTVTVTEKALEGVQGNKIGLKAGETVSFYDLICATLVGSGNDSAYVIAHTVAGSLDSFVDMMNEKAKSLGAENTVYANPGGYHSPLMHTTLFDQALICAHAATLELLSDISSFISYDMPETNLSRKRTFTNQNLLFDPNHWLRHYTPNTTGFNVGMTEQAGWCMATAYDDDGLTNIVLVSGGRIENFEYHYLNDVKKLIEYTKNSHAYVNVLSKGEALHEAYVSLGRDRDSLILETAADITALLPTDIDIEKDVSIEWELSCDTFEAPVEAGEVFGTAKAFYKGELVGETALVAATGIDRSLPLFLFDRIADFFKIPVVKSILWFLSSLVFAFFAGAFIYVAVKRRRRRIENLRHKTHARKSIKKV